MAMSGVQGIEFIWNPRIGVGKEDDNYLHELRRSPVEVGMVPQLRAIARILIAARSTSPVSTSGHLRRANETRSGPDHPRRSNTALHLSSS